MNKIVILLVALLGVSLFTACETKHSKKPPQPPRLPIR